MIVRGIQSNQKGFFTKEDIKKLDLPIFDGNDADYYLTKTKLKKEGIKLNQNVIDEYVVGFYTRKGMRGYSPVFSPDIMLKDDVEKGFFKVETHVMDED